MWFWFVLFACTGKEDDSGPPVTETDADTDTDSDTDADTDTDTDADSDSSVALRWSIVDITGADTFVTGHLGVEYTDRANLPDFDRALSLCWNAGTLVGTGTTPPACEHCEWSFDVQVVETVAEGDYCGQFGRVGGEFDGLSMSLGGTSLYTIGYGYYEFELADVLFYYRAPYGWQIMSYDYRGYGYNTTVGDTMYFRTYAGSYEFYPY